MKKNFYRNQQDFKPWRVLFTYLFPFTLVMVSHFMRKLNGSMLEFTNFCTLESKCIAKKWQMAKFWETSDFIPTQREPGLRGQGQSRVPMQRWKQPNPKYRHQL